MQFRDSPQLGKLVIDFEVGFFGREEEADYFLYKQVGNAWVPVESVRAVIGARGRGVRKRMTFDVTFDDDDFRSRDRVNIHGSAGFQFQVLYPDKTVQDSDDLSTVLLNEISDALNDQFGKYQAVELKTREDDIKRGINDKLKRLRTERGFVLTILRLAPRTRLDALAGEIVETQAQQILDRINTQFQVDMKLLVGQADIQLDAQQVIAIGQANNDVQIDLMKRKAETLLEMKLTPQELPAFISIVDPDAALALAKVMKAQTKAMMAVNQIQLEEEKVKLLQRYLENKQSSTGPSLAQITSPHVLPQQIPARSSDPVEAAIRRAFLDVKDIQWNQEGRRKKYVVEFEDLSISFFTSANEISRVYFGTSSPTTPLTKLKTIIPKGDDIENLATQLIEDIRNDYAKWQGRH